MNIAQVVFKRFLRLLATLLIASSFLFILLRIVPGDPARVIVGINSAADEALLNSIRERFALNKPLAVQYADWILATFSFTFGDSWQRSLPVGQLIAERIGITLGLAFSAMFLSLLLAIPAGILSAMKRGLAEDRSMLALSHTVLAVPEFWLGIFLLLAFSVFIPIFPLFGSTTALHFVLPVIALGIGRAAFLLRLVRTSILRELRKPYILFLEQLRIPPNRLLLRHALPNAIIPIAIPAGIQLGYLLGGAIIIEQVFSMGGLGRLLLQAIQTRDYPLIHGSVIVLAIVFSLVNFLADLAVTLADPQAKI